MTANVTGTPFAGINDNTTFRFKTPDTLPPTLTSISPADNYLGFGTKDGTNTATGTITLTYSEPVALGTGNIYLVPSDANGTQTGTPIAINVAGGANGTVTASGNTVTIVLANSLLARDQYYTITADAVSVTDISPSLHPWDGKLDSVPTDGGYDFQTVTDILPTLSSFSPITNSFGVPIGSKLTLDFSTPVTASTGNITLVDLSNSADNVTIAANSSQVTFGGTTQFHGLTHYGSIVTIQPKNPLIANQQYAVEIDGTAFVDTSANAYAGIANTTTWFFSTPTGPLVTTPVPGAGGVVQTTPLTITFDRNIAIGTTGSIALHEWYTGAVIASYSVATNPHELAISGATLTITPDSQLPDLTTVYVTIDPGAILDTNSTPDQFYGFTDRTVDYFTTRGAATPTSLTPADNATGVSQRQQLMLTFPSGTIPSLGTTGQIRVYEVGTGTNGTDSLVATYDNASQTNTTVVTISGNTVVITPYTNYTGSGDGTDHQLRQGQTYYVQIDPGAIRTDTTNLLSESFDKEPLIRSVTQDNPPRTGGNDNGQDYTLLPPPGWVSDPTGQSLGDSNIPVTPYDPNNQYLYGWTVVNKSVWIAEQGNQNRTDFTLGTGNVLVADGDAYADRVPISKNYDVVMYTPQISTAGIDPSTLQLTFDSSFRPEADDEYGTVDESFDGGKTWTQIFRRDRAAVVARTGGSIDSATGSTIFDNEAVDLPISGASGDPGSTVEFRFSYLKASNDWWWAIDNVKVTAKTPSSTTTPYQGIQDNTTWRFSTSPVGTLITVDDTASTTETATVNINVRANDVAPPSAPPNDVANAQLVAINATNLLSASLRSRT